MIESSRYYRCRDAVFNHEFFALIVDGGDEVLWRIFAKEYWWASSQFTSFLGSLVSTLPNDEARANVVENLWDEFGCGDKAGWHRRLLLKFVNACGVQPENTTISETASLYITSMKALCSSENYDIGLGAFGPGCEDITPFEYKKIVTGARVFGEFTDEDLGFFIEHLSHDGDHIDDLSDVARANVRNRDDFELGACMALVLEKLFYDGIIQQYNAER